METSPVRQFVRYRFVAFVTIVSIALALMWWAGRDMNVLVGQRVLVHARPWTLVTSAFLHRDPIHLAFNLYWWWRFATLLERNWGAGRLAGIFLLLAVFSGLAQVVLSRPGVGLSGVVYGLWTLLLVLEKRRPAFAGILTPKINGTFVTWFIVCIATTAAGVWNVGNVAHGAGALAGWLLGRVIIAERHGAGRTGAVAALAVLSGILVAGTFPAKPWWRFSHVKGEDGYYGALAVQSGEYERGVALLESARKNGEANDAVLVNLGTGYQHLERHHEALEIYRELRRSGSVYTSNVRGAAVSILSYEASDAADRRDLVSTRALMNEMLEWEPGNDWARQMRAWLDQEEARVGGTP